MRVEKEKELMDIFPDMFSSSRFRFDCEDGWFNILYDLIGQLRQISFDYGCDITASQIKEKFGALRVYIDPLDSECSDLVHETIEEAEALSAKTCEMCGKPGLVNYSNSFIRCLCGSCRK